MLDDWLRQVRALEQLFPRTWRKLGDEAFTSIAARSIAELPSRSSAIELLGLRFPTFSGAHHGRSEGELAAFE